MTHFLLRSFHKWYGCIREWVLQSTSMSTTYCYFKGNLNPGLNMATTDSFSASWFVLHFCLVLLNLCFIIFLILFCFNYFFCFIFCFVHQDYVLRQVEPKYHKLGWPSSSPDGSFIQPAYQAEWVLSFIFLELCITVINLYVV